MADSEDGDYVEELSDDDLEDHRVTSGGGSGGGISSNYGTRSKGRRNSSGGGPRKGKQEGREKKKKAAWEDIQRSWEADVVENPDGTVTTGLSLEAEKRRRLLQRDATPLQRGIIRHLMLVVDMSFAMAERDMLPNRYRVVMAYAADFVREFFEQNPISQLGVVGMRDGVAHRVSDLSGSPQEHVERLRAWAECYEPSGSPSLQNALEMCRAALFHAPAHGTREALVVYGALLSSDPGDIHDTIDNLVRHRIRVSVIGLAAQVAICAELCARTNSAGSGGDGGGNGDDSRKNKNKSKTASSSSAQTKGAADGSGGGFYHVAMHDVHLRELLMQATTPPATGLAEKSNASLLLMGFPSRSVTASNRVSLCACHHRPMREGYSCTRCGAKVCRLPAECPACGLTLILSTHLARSYHHLFPLRVWADVRWSDAGRSAACFSCKAPFPPLPPPPPPSAVSAQQQQHGGGGGGTLQSSKAKEKAKEKSAGTFLSSSSSAAPVANSSSANNKGVSESGRYACEVCGRHFCVDCDVFAHEVIHSCPGCQSESEACLTRSNCRVNTDSLIMELE